ncbi:MAG: Calx-beta domain-containing protein, partial [Pyrinomonadaceae bacterium]
GSVAVTTQAGCAVTAASNAPWLANVSVAANNIVTFFVATNTGAERSGTLTISGRTFTVTQVSGAACTYEVFPPLRAFTSEGGTAAATAVIGVAGEPNFRSGTCAWTATPNAPWLTITAGASGAGTGRVRYTVSANPGASTRTGTLTVAGQTYTVTQTAATTPSVQFEQAAYSAGENAAGGVVTIALTRTGDTAGAASVEYATVDDPAPVPCDPTTAPDAGQPPFPRGVAYARCDYATQLDRLTFAPGQTRATFTVPLLNDLHQDGTEAFQLALRDPQGATLGAQSTATVTITDDDQTAPTTTPVDQTPFFVRMQYLDFLSREPESGEPWSAILNGCPNVFNLDASAPSAQCDRLIVSQSFFGSPEFRLKGFFVFLYYRVSFGRILPEYPAFISDFQRVTARTDAELRGKRYDFAEEWVRRPAFMQEYGGLSNEQFVDALLGRYQLPQVRTEDPADPEGGPQVVLTRAELINRLNGGTLTRAEVLRALVQSNEVEAAEFNEAFVAMQYYGYLRRRPEPQGYQDQLNLFIQSNGDARAMIHSFLNSREYGLRFGRR